MLTRRLFVPTCPVIVFTRSPILTSGSMQSIPAPCHYTAHSSQQWVSYRQPLLFPSTGNFLAGVCSSRCYQIPSRHWSAFHRVKAFSQYQYSHASYPLSCSASSHLKNSTFSSKQHHVGANVLTGISGPILDTTFKAAYTTAIAHIKRPLN